MKEIKSGINLIKKNVSTLVVIPPPVLNSHFCEKYAIKIKLKKKEEKNVILKCAIEIKYVQTGRLSKTAYIYMF